MNSKKINVDKIGFSNLEYVAKIHMAVNNIFI